MCGVNPLMITHVTTDCPLWKRLNKSRKAAGYDEATLSSVGSSFVCSRALTVTPVDSAAKFKAIKSRLDALEKAVKSLVNKGKEQKDMPAKGKMRKADDAVAVTSGGTQSLKKKKARWGVGKKEDGGEAAKEAEKSPAAKGKKKKKEVILTASGSTSVWKYCYTGSTLFWCKCMRHECAKTQLFVGAYAQVLLCLRTSPVPISESLSLKPARRALHSPTYSMWIPGKFRIFCGIYLDSTWNPTISNLAEIPAKIIPGIHIIPGKFHAECMEFRWNYVEYSTWNGCGTYMDCMDSM